MEADLRQLAGLIKSAWFTGTASATADVYYVAELDGYVQSVVGQPLNIAPGQLSIAIDLTA